MAKEPMKWTVNAADGPHTVEYHPRGAFKAAKLFVDGERTKLLMERMGFEGMDMPILTESGSDIRFVSARGKTDIAVDGVYMADGAKYEPLPKMSKANWVFVIITLCAALLGGAIPLGCAFGGAAAGSAVALSKKLSNKAKIILGVVIMLAAWAAAIGIGLLAVKGINAAGKNAPKSFGKDEYSVELTRAFEKDPDSASLEDDGAVLLFAAMSDEAYAYAEKMPFKSLRELYDIDWTQPEEYLTAVLDADASRLKTTESGVTYLVLNGDEFSYVCSCIVKNEAFYYTEMYCMAKDAEKLVPRLIGWTNGIKVAETGQGAE